MRVILILLLSVFSYAQTTLLSDDFGNRIHIDDAVGFWVLIPEYHSGEATGKSMVQDLAGSNNMSLGGWSTVEQMADSAYTASPYYDGGNGVHFDGAASYLYIGSGATTPFKPGTGDFTIEVAYKLDDRTNENIVSLRDVSSGWWNVVVTNNNLFSLYSSANSPVIRETAVAISADTDYHFISAADRDGNLVTWRNAASANSLSITDFADDNIAPSSELRIGRQGNGDNYANGVIHFVGYYDSVLPTNTIKDHQTLPAGWKSLNGGGSRPGTVFCLGASSDTVYYASTITSGAWNISIKDSAASAVAYKILTSSNLLTWSEIASGTTGTSWQTKTYSGTGLSYIAIAVPSGTAYFDDLSITRTAATTAGNRRGSWLSW